MGNLAFDCFDSERAVRSIAAATDVAERCVRSAIKLLDEGNTIPFIARYRKEATRGLDEIAAASDRGRAWARPTSWPTQGDDPEDDRPAGIADARACDGRSNSARTSRRWKTCTCRSSPSDGHGPRSLANVVCSRWQTCCCFSSSGTGRDSETVLTSTLISEWPTRDAALQGACDIVAEQWSEDAWNSRLAGRTGEPSCGRIVRQSNEARQEDATAKFRDVPGSLRSPSNEFPRTDCWP